MKAAIERLARSMGLFAYDYNPGGRRRWRITPEGGACFHTASGQYQTCHDDNAALVFLNDMAQRRALENPPLHLRLRADVANVETAPVVKAAAAYLLTQCADEAVSEVIELKHWAADLADFCVR